MAKKIDGYINLQVKAGQANPSPPIVRPLGQRGVKHHGVLQVLQREDEGYVSRARPFR